jgi:flagellar motor switch protein FliN/FliY
MSQLDAVRRAAEMTAAACAAVLGQLVDAEGSFTGLEVDDTPVNRWDALEFPLVCVRIKIVSGIDGEYLFVLAPDQARLVAGAMGMGEGDAEGDLTEIELSAVGEAMNQMMATAAATLAEAISMSTEIAAPTVEMVATREEADQIGDARYTARFTIAAGELSADIVQVLSAELGAILDAAFSPAGEEAETATEAPAEAPADLSDSTLAAVEHAARIAATSSAEVLSTLIGDHVTATDPEVEAGPADPLGVLTYPRVLVEISHVAGLTCSSLFVFAPADSATLAAVMMGLDAPMGDGLSDLELSAVAEAMSQMMGGAASMLAETAGIEVEIAPPVCTVAADADEARAALADVAYSARFQIVSERLTADVLQLLPADLALQLDAVFGAGGGIGDGVMPTRPAGAPGSIASTNSAAARVAPGLLGFDSLRDVQVRVSAELGRARVPVSDVMNLPPGAIVELDRTPAETIDILVNGRAFARARLVLVDGEYAAQIVSLEPPTLMAG